MNAFIVKLENRPGALAEVGEALAERGVNITGISGMTWDGEGALALITNDEAATRSLLDERDGDYREVSLVTAAIEDRPGTLADAARRLASAGVNIDAVIPTGRQGSTVTVAFGVGDETGARDALGQLASTEAEAV
jgi:hypothetical protein